MGRSDLYFFLLFILPFAGALLATPIISKFASNKNIVDKPGLHKTHKEATPLLGGTSIFLCFAAVLFVFLPLDEKLLSLILSTIVLVATGLSDELYNLKPILKITGQATAASIVVLWNAHLFRFMADYFARFDTYLYTGVFATSAQYLRLIRATFITSF